MWQGSACNTFSVICRRGTWWQNLGLVERPPPPQILSVLRHNLKCQGDNVDPRYAYHGAARMLCRLPSHPTHTQQSQGYGGELQHSVQTPSGTL
jgi:hypothetical protein